MCAPHHCRFTRFSQLQAGLSVVFAPSTNYQAYSSTYSEGIKLLIHERDIYASDLSVEKMISHRSETTIRLVTTLTTCSQPVRSLSTEDRECVFQPERQLEWVFRIVIYYFYSLIPLCSFFDVYKENNCDVQCRMKKIINYCGCLPYYFRHVAPDVETCNFTQIQCLVDHYCKNGTNFFYVYQY